MFTSSFLWRGCGLLMGLLMIAAASLVLSEATTVRDSRISMKVSSHSGEVVQRTFGDDPCGGVCEGLGRSCVVSTKERAFCVDCSGLLRRRGSGARVTFAECCNYNPWKMRCGQALRETARGKCLRSENLFVQARPSPVPARFLKSSGNACGKPWDFRNNGLACRLTRPGNGKRRCINADGTEQLPPQCNTSFGQVGEDIDGITSDRSGASVAMSADGSRLVIGAPNVTIIDFKTGRVRVFELLESEGWVQLGDDIDGEGFDDFSGTSVAMSADGSRVAIGARGNDGNGRESGHVRVFELRESEGWVQLGEDIDGEAAWDASGVAVAMSADGSRVAIGAEGNDGNSGNSGHVRVFELQESEEWVQMGGDIDGEAARDRSGASIAMSADGSRVAIGARENDGNGASSGHVRVLELQDSEGWVQLGGDVDGEAAFDDSGWSVAMSADGSRVAIGTPFNNDNGASSGHVRVFELQESEGWVQLGDDIDGESEDWSGWSVAMSADGRRVAIGAPRSEGNGPQSGHVRVFDLQEGEGWVQVGEDLDGERRMDSSGESVAMSADGSRLAIGAPNNGFRSSGHVRVFETMKQCD